MCAYEIYCNSLFVHLPYLLHKDHKQRNNLLAYVCLTEDKKVC